MRLACIPQSQPRHGETKDAAQDKRKTTKRQGPASESGTRRSIASHARPSRALRVFSYSRASYARSTATPCRERNNLSPICSNVLRLNRINLRSCKSYFYTVLFSLFNTVPNIVSLVRSGFLPVSVCFFQNSDLRNENSELSSDNQMRGQIDLGTDSYRSTYSAQVDSHLQRDSYANFKNDQFGIDSY